MHSIFKEYYLVEVGGVEPPSEACSTPASTSLAEQFVLPKKVLFASTSAVQQAPTSAISRVFQRLPPENEHPRVEWLTELAEPRRISESRAAFYAAIAQLFVAVILPNQLFTRWLINLDLQPTALHPRRNRFTPRFLREPHYIIKINQLHQVSYFSNKPFSFFEFETRLAFLNWGKSSGIFIFSPLKSCSIVRICILG